MLPAAQGARESRVGKHPVSHGRPTARSRCPLPWPQVAPLMATPAPQVNDENVVKAGHRQVVHMIRQGGDHLVLKVVTVTRNLDPDDTARKKGGCPSGPQCVGVPFRCVPSSSESNQRSQREDGGTLEPVAAVAA